MGANIKETRVVGAVPAAPAKCLQRACVKQGLGKVSP